MAGVSRTNVKTQARTYVYSSLGHAARYCYDGNRYDFSTDACVTVPLLGVPSTPNAPSEATAVAVDFAMRAVGGGYGVRQANIRYPLPNVRKELAIIANSSRRSLRPAKVESFTQYANQQQINNTVRRSVIGTSVVGFFTDLFFRAGNVFNPPPVRAKEKVTSKICYTDESGKRACQ